MIPIRDTLPSRRFPIVTVALIVINLLGFLFQGYLQTQPERLNDGIAWQNEGLAPPGLDADAYRAHVYSGGDPSYYPISAGNYLITQYAVIPAELLRGEDLPPAVPVPLWLTVLTSMFLHGGLLHLLGNMLYLWIFGDNVEDAMGPIRFLIFYIVCGAAAALAQIAVDPGSAIPFIGASGAIAGVLAAYFMLFPYARVLTLVPIFFFLRLIPIPAVFLLGFWFLLQVINGAGSLGSGGGVAWFAHIGGFVAGAILVFVFRRRGVPVTLWRTLRRGHS
jgi:membrane associated rhomboid family serine protease